MNSEIVRRYDRGEFRGAKRTPQGFLRCDGFLTRTGVFEYRLPDGSTRREYRPEDEVFHSDALASCSLAPVTVEHPAEAVSVENTRKYQVGTVGENVARDGQFVRSTVLVTDSDAIRAIEGGEKRELSCGYTTRLDATPGVFDGQAYDAIQREIRCNHVAIVSRGRAGPEVRLRLDAKDAVMVEPEYNEQQPAFDRSINGDNYMGVKIKINGVEYEGTDLLAQAFFSHDAKLNSEIEQAKAEAVKIRKDSEEAIKNARSDAEKQKARADALDAEKAKLEKERQDAQDPKRVREAIKSRVALETKAASVLGMETKLDELDDLSIRKTVVTKLLPTVKLDGKSADYVEGLYDHALTEFEKRNPSLEAARKAANESGRADASDPDEARKRMIERNAKAWLK